jgi:hypothetical protein
LGWAGVFAEDLHFSAAGVHAVTKEESIMMILIGDKEETYVSEPWLWQSVYEDGGS